MPGTLSRPRGAAGRAAPVRRPVAAPPDEPLSQARFTLTLANFEGPFDLLLQLIGKHKLDVTEVALSQVTDEFIAYITAGTRAWELEQTSSFLVVAATLLDLKAARLLPGGQVEDVEDLAVLEARDLLFARLLQYRAFKRIAAWIAERWDAEARVFANPGGLSPELAALSPDVEIPGGAEHLARVAARVFAATEPAGLPVEHLYLPTVSVQEQADLLAERLRHAGVASFRALVADADRLTTVVRFLALLELFRQEAVAFEQVAPLGELTVRWTGEGEGPIAVSDEYDGTAGGSGPARDEEGSGRE